VVRHIIEHTNDSIINVDGLTFVGNIESIATVADNERYHFVQADIFDAKATAEVLDQYQPYAILHLAAKAHVYHSIKCPSDF
jgi:dTDP-glucose 4,6-dehydratase